MEIPGNLPPKSPEFNLEAQDRIMIIGAGGFTANQLYLRNLVEMGVDPSQIALVDTDEERLQSVHDRLPEADAFDDTDHALQELADSDKRVPYIFITSSTAAHDTNIRSIVNAATAGLIDLEQTRIWCEKPVTDPEVFEGLYELVAEHPEFDLSVGYILRFSETLTALQAYLEEQDLQVTGMDWKYGKDRTKDTRPTQGVFPDEVVHPLSVTDLVLGRNMGRIASVDVESSQIQRRPFANEEIQGKAHVVNPSIPLNPTSDVEARLHYVHEKDDTTTSVPVTISSSFLFPEESRRAAINVDGPAGPDTLLLDFDIRETDDDGQVRRVDRLSHTDGAVIYESGTDKSRQQILDFLRSHTGDMPDTLTNLEGEIRIQRILTGIGQAALTGA